METLFSDNRDDPCDRNDPCVWIVRDRLEFYPCDRDDRKSNLYALIFFNGNRFKQSLRQKRYDISHDTSLCCCMCSKMAVNNSNNTSSFMEEVQKYYRIYNKFAKDYKNRRARENAWAKIAEKFGLTSEDAKKKCKNIRTSYVRYLKRLKNVPSGSGRDPVPKAGEFANLEWLDQYISHRKSMTNLPNHESDDEEAIDNQQQEEMNNSCSSSTKVVDDDTSPDIELDIADSPESSTTTTQTSVSTAELGEIPSKKKSSASTSKTKWPWAASNHQKAGSSKDVDLAMIQIAEKLLNEPSEKPSSDINEVDEHMHFAKSFTKRLKKLPERAPGTCENPARTIDVLS